MIFLAFPEQSKRIQFRQKRHLKIKTLAQLRLFCDYLILFACYNVNQEPCNWISLSAVKANTQN